MQVANPIVDDFEIPNMSEDPSRPIQEPICRWKHNLMIGYFSMNEIRRSQVIVVDWYKNTSGLEDEYLVAECRRRPGGIKFYLRIERRPPGCDGLIPVEAPSAHTIPDIHVPPLLSEIHLRAVEVEGRRQLLKIGSWITTQIATQKVEEQKLKAMDFVTRVKSPAESLQNGEPVQLIARYHAFQKAFYVRDLAFLADSVTARQPLSQIFPHQNFWYPRSILNVATAVYRPAAVRGPGFERAGTYRIRRGFIPVSRLKLSADYRDETNTIKESFESALESHTIEVERRFFKRCGRLEEKLQEEIWKRHELEGQVARRR